LSLIEKAVQRLEELKRAGITLPSEEASSSSEREGSHRLAAQKAVRDIREAHDETAQVRPMTVARPAQDTATAAPANKAALDQRRDVSKSIELDLARMAAAGMVTPDAPRSRIADEYRVIKRPLIMNAQGKGAVPVQNGNLIMVTSSMPGEGKSFTAINLAMSIAMELDNTVLLVDADVARPSILRHLGLPPAKGLMDVLTGDRVALSEVMLRTNVEKLSILPAGTAHSRATEFLASDGMIQLLDEMATRYSDRIIIFDSPPLLVTTEARTVAAHMGQVIMVVEAEKTTQSAVKQALTTIEACPVKLLMLNKTAHGKAGGYGYGGYYGYYGYGGYGYGYGKGPDATGGDAA